MRNFWSEVWCDEARKRCAILVHLGPFAESRVPENGFADGPICARIRARRRALHKGVICEHGKDSEGFDCGPGDVLRDSGSAATGDAGAAGESVYLQRDGGGEDCHGGELSASERFDDDWISRDAAA